MKLRFLFQQFTQQCHDATVLGKSPRTVRNYELAFDLFERCTKIIYTDELTQNIVRLFLKKGIDERQWKPGTVHSYAKNLATFFKWLVNNGHITANPLTGIHLPPILENNPVPYSESEIDQIMAAIEVEFDDDFSVIRNKAMTSVLIMTGMRKGEMLGLRTEDVDFGLAQIRILAINAKSRRPLSIPMSERLIARLQGYYEARATRDVKTQSFWVSCNDGKGLTESGFKRITERLSKRLKFRFKPQRFRQTFASQTFNATGNIFLVMGLLGHRQVKTTFRYTKPFDSELRKAVNMNPLNALI